MAGCGFCPVGSGSWFASLHSTEASGLHIERSSIRRIDPSIGVRRQRRPRLDDLHNHDHWYFGFDAALDDSAADREVTARRGGCLPRVGRARRSISESAGCCGLQNWLAPFYLWPCWYAAEETPLRQLHHPLDPISACLRLRFPSAVLGNSTSAVTISLAPEHG